MKTYIVSYDLFAPGQNYDKLIELIKSEYAWAKIGYSAFIVKSSLSHTELRDKFKHALDSNDKLFVVQFLLQLHGMDCLMKFLNG